MIFGIEMLEALGGMLSLECDVDRMDVDMTEETTDFGPIGTTVTVCPTHLVLASGHIHPLNSESRSLVTESACHNVPS